MRFTAQLDAGINSKYCLRLRIENKNLSRRPRQRGAHLMLIEVYTCGGSSCPISTASVKSFRILCPTFPLSDSFLVHGVLLENVRIFQLPSICRFLRFSFKWATSFADGKKKGRRGMIQEQIGVERERRIKKIKNSSSSAYYFALRNRNKKIINWQSNDPPENQFSRPDNKENCVAFIQDWRFQVPSRKLSRLCQDEPSFSNISVDDSFAFY